MRWLAAPDLFEPPSSEIVDMAELAIEARWAGVPIWDLAEKPEYWRSVIRLGREVENHIILKRKG